MKSVIQNRKTTKSIYLGEEKLRTYTWALEHFRTNGLLTYALLDVDVVKLRAQANASMPASYNSNIQLLILILISNNNSDFRLHEFRL